MIKKFFFSFFLTTILFAQTNSLLEVKKLYEDYEYEKVIQTSNVLLNDEQFPDSLKIDLYFMRAVSFFAIGNENLSKTNFENLLKLNKNYILDTSKLSPKIINFFDEVKKEYLKKEEEKIYSPENLEKLKQLAQERENELKYSVLKNIFLPGWGQVSLNNQNKGYALIGLSISNLVAAFYYIYDTNKKENDYLSEIEKTLIPLKYSRYNDSYKKRNVLLSTFAFIWLYSQLDLLLNEKYKVQQNLPEINLIYDSNKNYKLNFLLRF
ncbi:MAG: hypothetical protein N2321_01850 [Melioribacteraceae bacterium]|nr:hypothetical protein [Melioribacteraceae bacterium]